MSSDARAKRKQGSAMDDLDGYQIAEQCTDGDATFYIWIRDAQFPNTSSSPTYEIATQSKRSDINGPLIEITGQQWKSRESAIAGGRQIYQSLVAMGLYKSRCQGRNSSLKFPFLLP